MARPKLSDRLPPDVAWMEHKRCKPWMEVIFFPKTGGNSKGDSERAKEICGQCPVIIECREYATARDEHGIWGGMTRRERRAEAKRLKALAAVTAQGSPTKE